MIIRWRLFPDKQVEANEDGDDDDDKSGGRVEEGGVEVGGDHGWLGREIRKGECRRRGEAVIVLSGFDGGNEGK